MARARGTPVLVMEAGGRQPLERIYLGKGNHNENWLQALIQAHPHLLPVADIEPGFGDVVPLAREVPCERGFIDNLFMTPSGDIVLVETKLWRNNEIRREVVAQALDYVAALTAMSYAEFENAVARGEGAPSRIYDLFADHPEALEEARFIDAASNNLRRGRMLVMVLGDGIRRETEALASLLQSHAGAHFTFSLIEVATWRTGTGSILAIPDTLAKTVMIERGIVRMESTGLAVSPPPPETKPRAQSISMQDFMGLMAERNPGLPDAIDAFLEAAQPLGVYGDLKASLSFKVDLPGLNRPANFGYIDRNAKFWSSPAAWNLPEHVWRPYFDTLASLIGGHVIDEPNNCFVALSGRSAPRITDLLPAHQEAWIAAIAAALKALREDDS